MNKLFYDNSFPNRFVRHLLFFFLTVLIFAYVFYAQNSSDSFLSTIWITFVNALFFFGYAYITIFLLIPEFLLKGKKIWFILLFILVGFGLSAMKLIFSEHIFYSSIAPENIPKSGIVSLRFIVVNTKDMTFIVALFCIAKYVKDYLYTDSIRKKLEIQNKEAQSKLLQSQFDPHFLFNTINNLYALSLLNPLKTRDVISRIKIVLRYIINESQKDFVELEEELSFIENYIQLEKLRYGKRLKVDFLIQGETRFFKLPPMSLFVLIENCFKHGSSLDAGTPWIKVRLKTKPGKIFFTTENSKPKRVIEQQIDVQTGKGIRNLKKRLDIIYSNKGYDLKFDDKESTFLVKLELKENGIEIARKTYR